MPVRPVSASGLNPLTPRDLSFRIMSAGPGPASVIEEMRETDVVKEGFLFVKRPPGHKWNKFRVSASPQVLLPSPVASFRLPLVLVY